MSTTNWLLTNQKEIAGTQPAIYTSPSFGFYGPKEQLITISSPQPLTIFIDGFLLPIQSDMYQMERLTPQNAVAKLYDTYGTDLIHHVKGSFILIIFKGDEFILFSDKLGIKKCFHYRSNGSFIISNNLRSITSHIGINLDYDSIAIRALLHYYAGGTTFVKDVFYTQGATRMSFKGTLTLSTYWDCKELLEIRAETIPYDEFAFKFKEIVKSYLNFLKPKRVSVTLTGGLDSRTLLAVLMALDIKPVVFTYGQATSGDVQTAAFLARTCNLEFKNYPYPELSARWFSENAKEITEYGNSLISIHRAHRWDAMKQGKKDFIENEMLFGGFLGGENIRGIYYDNLIVSEFLWKCLSQSVDPLTVAKTILKNHYINLSVLDFDRIFDILNKQSYFSHKEMGKAGSINRGSGIPLENQFYMLYLLEAQLHHAQDLNLYSRVLDYPVPLFMDVDFLELLYRGHYDFRYINTGSHVLMKGIKGHELNCRLIKLLAPQLKDIPFLKRGYFSAAEYLGNKWLLLVKRAYRQLTGKAIIPNFPLDTWMSEYVGEYLASPEIQTIHEIYHIQELITDFSGQTQRGNNEAYWQKYTMPIALSLCLRQGPPAPSQNPLREGGSGLP